MPGIRKGKAKTSKTKERSQKGARKGTRTSPRRKMCLTAVCFDVSGSMRLGSKFTSLKEALVKEIEAADANELFLITAFSHETSALSSAPMDKQAALEAVQTQLPTPNGGTAIFRTVAEMGGCIQAARKADERIAGELVVLKIFTDGDDNESLPGEQTEALEAAKRVREAGGVVTLMQAGSSPLCANALELPEDAVLYFSDHGGTLANAALAAREASTTYRSAVASRAPTVAMPTFSFTGVHRAMSIDPLALPSAPAFAVLGAPPLAPPSISTTETASIPWLKRN